jgi:uncharacterized protein YndB with AHSA1/START domain
MSRQSDVTLPADAPEFVLTRVFDAPRALVFKCWMEPSHLSEWWGPKPFTCPVCEVDARVGGKFRLVMRSPDGADYPMRGTFREIVPDIRIVKEDDLSENSEEWQDIVDPARKGQGKRKITMLTNIAFADEGKGTRVTITTRFPSLELRDNFAKTGMEEGWSSSLEKLDELLDAIKDKPNEIHIRRLIAAPREMVFAAFSDPKGLAQWWGPNGFTTTTDVLDFREGGEWIFTMHGPDGTDYPNYVLFTKIEAPRLIVHDHGVRKNEPPLFKGSVSFEDQGGKTLVTLSLEVARAEQRDTLMTYGAVRGGIQNLERLDAFLEKHRRNS